MKETLRYIAGYFIGLAVFMILVPWGLISLSRLDILFPGKVLFTSVLLRDLLASIAFLTGAFFAAWSNIFLFMAGKGGPTDAFGVSVSPRTRKLVTTGPYRYSRNPMVFGAFSLYFSLVVYLNSITCLAVLLLFLFLAFLFLKISEEKRLLRDFGDEYREYRKRVSMIFPWLRKRNHEKETLNSW